MLRLAGGATGGGLALDNDAVRGGAGEGQGQQHAQRDEQARQDAGLSDAPSPPPLPASLVSRQLDVRAFLVVQTMMQQLIRSVLPAGLLLSLSGCNRSSPASVGGSLACVLGWDGVVC